MEYITSDHHFGHRNILTYCDRNFTSVDEMNEYLIKAHNRVVDPRDTTYDLGDISIGISPEEVFEYYKRMNGQFVMIRGNHDHTNIIKYFTKNNYTMKDGRPKFIFHDVGCRIKRNKKIFYLTHFPMQVGNREKYFNLCGHIHQYTASGDNSLNVGIDSPEIKPEHWGSPVKLSDAMAAVVKKGEKAGFDNRSHDKE